MVCDLADLNSVRAAAAVLQSTSINTLCNNAGLAMNTADKEAKRTAEGFELTVRRRILGGERRKYERTKEEQVIKAEASTCIPADSNISA